MEHEKAPAPPAPAPPVVVAAPEAVGGAPMGVEQVLSLHPHVRDVGIVGIADEEWGEVGLAVVVAEPGVTITLDELNTFAAQRLARYKLPKRLAVVDELPRNVTGKLSREQLRSNHQGV